MTKKLFNGYHQVSGSPTAPRSRSAPARSRRLSLLRLAGFCGAPRMALAKTGARLRVAVPCFLLRASSRPCKRQTAAPAPPRLLLPQTAPRLRSQRQLPASSTGCGRCRCLRRGTMQTQRIHSALPRPAAEICGQVFHKDFLFCGESETLLKKAHPSPFSRTTDPPKADGLSATQPLSNKISPPPKERGNFSVIGAAMRGYSKTDGTAFLRDRPSLAKRGNPGIPTLCIVPGRRQRLAYVAKHNVSAAESATIRRPIKSGQSGWYPVKSFLGIF